jgi:hypothetical protein
MNAAEVGGTGTDLLRQLVDLKADINAKDKVPQVRACDCSQSI